MFGTRFNIAHIEPESRIYGPGNRFVIWFQGCTLACEGCWNTAMWSCKANTLFEREDLLKQILRTDSLVGVTFLGGEPLLQSKNLEWLLVALSKTNLDIMLYSGYSLKEIQDQPVGQKILRSVDILIAGRYEQSLRNTSLLWRGSENQQVLYLSDRYDQRQCIEDCNQVEIHIDELGSVITLGYPDDDLLTDLALLNDVRVDSLFDSTRTMVQYGDDCQATVT